MKVFVVIVALLCLGAWFIDRDAKIAFSPCGTTNLTTKYVTSSGLRMFRLFDDGKKVWRIERINKPVSDGAPPTVDMTLEFERSPENCAIWKMEKGIKD